MLSRPLASTVPGYRPLNMDPLGRLDPLHPTSPHLLANLQLAFGPCQGKTFRFFKEICYPPVWLTDGVRDPPAPRQMVETDRLTRLVVLERFGEPGLDLSNPGPWERVGREEFRLARAALRCHADPQVTRRGRLIARLGHEDEPEVIGLRLLQATPRQKQPHGRARAEGGGDQLHRGRVTRRERGLSREEPALHGELLAEPLAPVARDRVRDLMAEDSGQPGVVASDRQDPRVHRDLAARQAERVRLLVLEDAELPLVVRASGGLGDPGADTRDLVVQRGI